MKKNNHQKNKGVILVMALIGSLAAAIMVPAIYTWVQTETKQSSKSAKTTTAFHMAEQGADRGLWKLQESNSIFNSVAQGGTVPGYNFDVVYTSTDSSGGKKLGEYKIKLSPGSTSGEVKILSVGRDIVISTNEVRAIEAVYETSSSTSSGSTSTMESGGLFEVEYDFKVHWGPITSYASIQLEGAQQSIYYPKRISVGAITPWDSSPSLPNSDPSKNYESYRTDLLPPSVVDIDSYKTKAQNSSVPNPAASGGSSSSYNGSGYFSSGDVILKDYDFNNSTSVIYVESGDVTLKSSAGNTSMLRLEALLAPSGKISIKNNGRTGYVVSVPPDAWKQYTAAVSIRPMGPGDSSVINEYPGDAGNNLCYPTWTLPNATFDGAATGVAFHGFLYSQNLVWPSGTSNIIVGVIRSSAGMDIDANSRIYFDPTVMNSSQSSIIGGKLTKKSWREVKTTW